MASIAVHHLDDTKTRLRAHASANGRSMEEEARIILCEAVGLKAEPENLAPLIPFSDWGVLTHTGGHKVVSRARC